MPLSTAACLDAIGRHSGGFADVAGGALTARVEHCPAWSVADLVWHLTEAHWFWGKIAAERPFPRNCSRRSAPTDTD